MRETSVRTNEDSSDVLGWYDELSSVYDELYGEEQSRKYTYVLKEFSLRDYLVNRKHVILDLGCGTGNLIKFLRKKFPSKFIYYVGLDLSPSMCLLSKKRVDNVGLLGDIVGGDVFRLPFRNEVANSVFSITVLTCRDSLKEVVTNFRELLRDNGLLYYTILCSDFSKTQEHGFELCEVSKPLSEREVLCVIKS